MRKLELQEVEDMIYGACIYGSGGGGSLADALASVRKIYAEGRLITMIGLDEVADEWTIASPYYVGSILPPPEHLMKRFESVPVQAESVSVLAFRALQEYLGKPIQAVIATELGGNTSCAMDTAATLGIPLIDADPAGRGMPELAHTTFNANGVTIHPFALASRFGDTSVVMNTVNHDHADIIARTFAGQFGNLAGVCDHPVDGKKLKESVIGGTLSLMERVGRARRLANELGKSTAEAIAAAGGGELLLEGLVREADWKDNSGFTEGNIIVDSLSGQPSESSLSIWYRNEHMTVHRGGGIISIIPELITIVDLDNGTPILNPSCIAGMKVAVITFPAPAEWETDAGIAVFGPAYIGMDRSIYDEIQRNKR